MLDVITMGVGILVGSLFWYGLGYMIGRYGR